MSTGAPPAGRRPLLRFIATQNVSAAFHLGATLVALVWANSPWWQTYEHVWETPLGVHLGPLEFAMSLRHWVNDGLMALFFFVAGLEIRREFDMGELRERRRVAVPVIAAVGGMAVPALIFLALNPSGEEARGWAMVMATARPSPSASSRSPAAASRCGSGSSC